MYEERRQRERRGRGRYSARRPFRPMAAAGDERRAISERRDGRAHGSGRAPLSERLPDDLAALEFGDEAGGRLHAAVVSDERPRLESALEPEQRDALAPESALRHELPDEARDVWADLRLHRLALRASGRLGRGDRPRRAAGVVRLVGGG